MKANIKYDLARKPHKERCYCNYCNNAIIEGYGFRVGDVIEYERRKCMVVSILPPYFESCCKITITDTNIESNFHEQLNDTQIVLLKRFNKK